MCEPCLHRADHPLGVPDGHIGFLTSDIDRWAVGPVPALEERPEKPSGVRVELAAADKVMDERRDAGELYLGGNRVDGLSETRWAIFRRRGIGFVFQAFNLVDELTSIENVELPALLVGVSRCEARLRAMDLLERLGVAERAGHLPDRLSGGERQRVAVARALVNAPLVVLADEPTGNLDSRATSEILKLLAGLREAGQALLIVTHDPRVASTADRLLTMRDGTIVAQTRLRAGTSTAGILASLADLGGEG